MLDILGRATQFIQIAGLASFNTHLLRGNYVPGTKSMKNLRIAAQMFICLGMFASSSPVGEFPAPCQDSGANKYSEPSGENFSHWKCLSAQRYK